MPAEYLASQENIPTKSPCPECGSYGNEQFYREHIERLNALIGDLKQKLESQRNKRLQEQDSRDEFMKELHLDDIPLIDLKAFAKELHVAGPEEVS